MSPAQIGLISEDTYSIANQFVNLNFERGKLLKTGWMVAPLVGWTKQFDFDGVPITSASSCLLQDSRSIVLLLSCFALETSVLYESGYANASHERDNFLSLALLYSNSFVAENSRPVLTFDHAIFFPHKGFGACFPCAPSSASFLSNTHEGFRKIAKSRLTFSSTLALREMRIIRSKFRGKI